MNYEEIDKLIRDSLMEIKLDLKQLKVDLYALQEVQKQNIKQLNLVSYKVKLLFESGLK